MHSACFSRHVHRSFRFNRGHWLSNTLVILLAIFLLFNGQDWLTAPIVYGDAAANPRTVDFYWDNFFNAQMISDVWLARQSFYGDRVLSWTYPVTYEWITLTGPTLPDGSPNPHPEGSVWYYAPARLKVTGRNLPEINITRPEFVPYNLQGGLSPTVVGGNANVSYYMQYITINRAKQLKLYNPGSYDGYISEVNGTIRMDRNGTMRILGLPPAQYESLKANPTGWWATNENTIETKWKGFLNYEANTRLEIQPMFEYLYTILSSATFPGVDLSLQYDAVNDLVSLQLDVVAWGNEALFARWFRETFLKGYEYWYSDLSLDVTITSSLSHVNLDTTVDWALYQWSVGSEKYAQGVWAFEPVLADEGPSIKISGKTYYSKEFPPYIFPNATYKTYYNVAPGNAWYDQYQPYDYVPSAWNLQTGETLRIDYSLPGPVWVLKQNPDGTVTNSTGFLDLSYTEPYLTTLGNRVSIDKTNSILTFRGPLNAEDWLKAYFPNEWARLADSNYPNGVLPWGVPYLEFFLESLASCDLSLMITSTTPSTTMPGTSVEISVIIMNLGDLVEVFNITAYYNNIPFNQTNNLAQMRHQASTLNFLWNTTGLSSGTWVIKVAVSGACNESNTFNNVGYTSVTLTSQTSGTVRDVKVVSITVSPNLPNVGDLVTLTVAVKNEGNVTENFNVTAFVNSDPRGTITLTNVAAGENRVVQFPWDTTGTVPGDYTISAVASQLNNETDTADNSLVYGVVTLNKMASSISITVTPSTINLVNSTTTATVSGRLLPIRQNVTIIIYSRVVGGSWNALSSVQTDANSAYSYQWTTTQAGTYEFKTSCPGDTYMQASESNVYSVQVKDPAPPSQALNPNDASVFYLLIGIVAGAIPPIAFLVLMKKRAQEQGQKLKSFTDPVQKSTENVVQRHKKRRNEK